MRNCILIFLAVATLSACTSKKNQTGTTAVNVDSIGSTITKRNQPPALVNTTDTIPGAKISKPAERVSVEKAGKHPITLQWIGWDKPGIAIVTPIGNGWYTITGKQLTNDRNYLRIEGKIKRLSEKELAFDGTIETRVESIYGGEPCIRKGIQRFFGKGTRTYFRLQNMENCEGGNLVDYVDIYPGNSSL